MDEKLGDTEQLSIDRTKYVVMNDEYKRFSKAAGLQIRHERLEMTGFGPKQHGAVENAYKEVEVARKTMDVSKQVKSSTPVASTASTSSSRKYADITGAWYPEAVPNSHTVQDLQVATVNGVAYQVDGRNVVLDYSEHEKEIAELLEREVGGEIYMVPRVNNPQGVSTPDYLFHGKGYDLKTIGKTTGKNPILNRIKKAKGQARCFIIDISKSELTEAVIEQQIDKIFWSKDTQFADELVIIHDGKIVRVIKRA